MAAGSDQALNTPTVLLAGAASQIGVFAIPRLLAAGFTIVAINRSGKPRGFQDDARVRWMDEAGAAQAAAACEYLLSVGPMDLAHRLLDVSARLRSAVVFSSTSAMTKADSANRLENAQARQLMELESRIESGARRKSARLVIFRPTLIYGCGLDNNISLLASWIDRFGFLPVSRKACGLRQPVHADDLASLAVTALLSHRDLPPLLDVAGGETLAYSQMAARIFPALEKPPRLLRLPEWLFVLMARAAGLLWPASGLNAEMVRRQAVDLVFDDKLARELLGYDPRPFNPTESDFSLPGL